MGNVFDDPLCLRNGGLSGSHPSPSDFTALPAQTPLANPRPILNSVARQEGMDEIPTTTAASFFRTYFQFIHPQYPFMDVKACGEWYTEWKMVPANNPINGWPAFFVKMVQIPFLLQRVFHINSDTDILHWLSHTVEVR
jgi:hypothetical protein